MLGEDVRERIWGNWVDRTENCKECPAHDHGYRPRYGGGDVDSHVMVVLRDPNDGRSPVRTGLNEPAPENESWRYGYKANNGWSMMEKYLNPICSRIDGCEDADDIYFTNAHKCPKLSGKGSFEKRDDDALKECRDYITDEIAAVNPQVILALSKQAMNTVGRSSEVEFEGSKRVTDYVREWDHGARFYGNKPSVVAGFHPSPTYLNQNLGKAGYDNKDKEWYYEQVAISVNVALSE